MNLLCLQRKNLSSDEDDEEEYGTSERHEMLPQQQQQQHHFGDDKVGDSAGSDPENPTAIKLRTCGFCGIQVYINVWVKSLKQVMVSLNC